MTSLLSVLSLVILVFTNGYFAIPIVNELTSTTLSHIGSTTAQGVQLQLISENETSTFSFPGHTQSTEVTTSASILGQLQENFARASRLFDQTLISQTATVTTEGNTSTTVPFTTSESSTNDLLHHPRGIEDENDDDNNNESKREYQEDEDKNQMESDAAKRDSSVETSTLSILSFPSTTTRSSRLNTLVTSTEKYTGLLVDNGEEIPKPKKTMRKQSKKSKINTEDQSDEESKVKPNENIKVKKPKKSQLNADDDSRDSSVPVAVFDQEALKGVPTIPNGVMVIDESTDLIVTDVPEKISKLKTEKTKELNQGKKSSHPKKEESDN